MVPVSLYWSFSLTFLETQCFVLLTLFCVYVPVHSLIYTTIIDKTFEYYLNVQVSTALCHWHCIYYLECDKRFFKSVLLTLIGLTVLCQI